MKSRIAATALANVGTFIHAHGVWTLLYVSPFGRPLTTPTNDDLFCVSVVPCEVNDSSFRKGG